MILFQLKRASLHLRLSPSKSPCSFCEGHPVLMAPEKTEENLSKGVRTTERNFHIKTSLRVFSTKDRREIVRQKKCLENMEKGRQEKVKLYEEEARKLHQILRNLNVERRGKFK